MKDWETHECEEKDELFKSIPVIKDKSLFEWGNAIDEIYYNPDFKMWKVTCHEYGCPINYCPFCGKRLNA